MLYVANLRVRSFSLDHLDIYWSLADGISEDPRDYEFVVQWSSSEFDHYADISGPIIDGYHFRDTTVRGQHSFYHKRYYRLIIRHRPTAKEQLFPEQGGVKLAAPPDLMALEMARQENLKLKEFGGRQVWVFPKRVSGPRCVACYDQVQRRRVRGDCAVCYGTGWLGGYHAPIACYMQIHTPTETTMKAKDGEIQVENTAFRLGNYPELHEGDLVVEAENVRWAVADSIVKVKKARAMIRQTGSLHRVPKTDVQYSVPVNLTTAETADLVASPHRNYTNPHNLETADLGKALLGLFGPRHHER